MSSTRTAARTTGVAVRAMLVLTLVLGVGYTLLVTGIGQLLLPWQANGSPLPNERGSSLIGQSLHGCRRRSAPAVLPVASVRRGRRLRRRRLQRQQPRPGERRPGGLDRGEQGCDRGARGRRPVAGNRPMRSPPRPRAWTRTSAWRTRCSRCRAWPRPADCPHRRCATSWSLGFKGGIWDSSARNASTSPSSISRSMNGRANDRSAASSISRPLTPGAALRVLLGAAPGVGKTYEMLAEGRRMLDEGHDVVIAIVETHERAATQAQDRRAPRGAAAGRSAPGHRPDRARCRRRAGAGARDRPRGRAGPHQRPRIAQREALAGTSTSCWTRAST